MELIVCQHGVNISKVSLFTTDREQGREIADLEMFNYLIPLILWTWIVPAIYLGLFLNKSRISRQNHLISITYKTSSVISVKDKPWCRSLIFSLLHIVSLNKYSFKDNKHADLWQRVAEPKSSGIIKTLKAQTVWLLLSRSLLYYGYIIIYSLFGPYLK